MLQLLLQQQQRKIDELHANLLKEVQKNVHLRVKHHLLQKQKQVDKQFNQQVEEYVQPYQEKQTDLPSGISSNSASEYIKNNHFQPRWHTAVLFIYRFYNAS